MSRGGPTINSSNKNNQATDQTLVPVTNQNCSTQVKKTTYSNSWRIEDVATLVDINCKNLVSKEFFGITGNNLEVSWRYRLNPNYFVEYPTASPDELDIEPCYLVNIDFGIICTPQAVTVTSEIADYKDNKIAGTIGEHVFQFCIPRDTMLLMDGALTLRFTVTFINDDLEDASRRQLTLPKSTLVENLASLFQNKQFADLTIAVGSETFRVHKAILVARSTGFATMFQHDMQESQRNEITITDMEPMVFEEVLRFIYTDEVEGLPQMAPELLAAADRYDLDRLKVMCEIALIKCITVNSATETLILADLHRAKELKARAIQFIGQNMKAMANWGEFCSSRPDLVAEILNGVAASK